MKADMRALVGVLCITAILCGCGGDGGSNSGNRNDTETSSIGVGGSVVPKADGSVHGIFFVRNQNGDILNVYDSEVTVEESTNGVSWQAVTMKSKEAVKAGKTTKADPGVAVAITMDYSQTMTDADALEPMQQAVAEFIDHMGGSDAGEIIKFADDVNVVLPFTSDIAALRNSATDSSYPAGGNTSLYDSMWQGIVDVSALTWDGLKAVLSMTDGLNNDSEVTREEVVNAAIANGVPIFTVGLGEDISEATLMSIAEQTHGFYYKAPTADQLFDCYERIAGIMDKSVSLKWTSTAASGPIQCKVTVSYVTAAGTFTAMTVFNYTH